MSIVNLLLYILLLAAGMLLSRFKLFGDNLYHSVEKIQMLCLMVLLFAMGISLGMNDEILKSLATIGLRGILFGLSTIAMSILFVHLASRFLLKGGKR